MILLSQLIVLNFRIPEAWKEERQTLSSALDIFLAHSSNFSVIVNSLVIKLSYGREHMSGSLGNDETMLFCNKNEHAIP